MKRYFVAAALWLALWGCNSDAIVNESITIVPDSDTVVVTIQGDTIIDTVFVGDTLIDTLEVFITDTLTDTLEVFITDTLTPVQRSMTYMLDGHVRGDKSPRTLDLGSFPVSAPTDVWVEVTLSGTSQRDEAWSLSVGEVALGDPSCPVVPDHPWFGTGWIYIGRVEEVGELPFTVRHAILMDCYPGIDDDDANSVHFERLRLEWSELQ